MPYPYSIDNINKRAAEDPEGFARECEAIFNRKAAETAAVILERAVAADSHIVFLSGPSGSGKTTTAKKICSALEGLGVHAETVSMDKYFVAPDPETSPRTIDGEFDRESPYCLDLDLLNDHIHLLEREEDILIPHFSFVHQARDPDKAVPMKRKRGDIVIFEGIHALNDMLTAKNPNAFKMYVSARSDVVRGGEVCFKRTWTRLLRRIVRDELFRGMDASVTLNMWANVRRGEKIYISPFKYKADMLFDSSMEYEIPVMKKFALKAFRDIPAGTERIDEFRIIPSVLGGVEEIDAAVVPRDSLLREFIGGSVFDY